MDAAIRSLDDLPGWAADDTAAALAAFGIAADNPKVWAIESLSLGETIAAEFTGYYEPVLDAARQQGGRFQFPIHRLSETGVPSLPRAKLTLDGYLEGLEIAWLNDPLEAFLLQVQGSGRLRFADGSEIRVGYAGSNGQAYVSIGKLLVERGAIPADEVSIAAIRDYATAHPDKLTSLLNENPSYVFFREVTGLPESAGPIGTAGVPLTAMRSAAVDPSLIPLGTLLWMEASGPDPIRALVVAQDTGSAIKGARVDLFFGTGEAAGTRAGAFQCSGRITPLIQRDGAAS